MRPPPPSSPSSGPVNPGEEIRRLGDTFEAALERGASELSAEVDRYLEALSRSVVGGLTAWDRVGGAGEGGLRESGGAVRAFADAMDGLLSGTDLAEAAEIRDGFLRKSGGRFDPPSDDWPEALPMEGLGGPPGPTPPRVRGRWWARAGRRLRNLVLRTKGPELPLGPLWRFYARGELPLRLVEPLRQAARLRAVAVAGLDGQARAVFSGFRGRWLDDSEELQAPEEVTGNLDAVTDRTLALLDAGGESVKREIRAAARDVAKEFRAAASGQPLGVSDALTLRVVDQAERRWRHALGGWKAWESARMDSLRTRMQVAKAVTGVAECAASFEEALGAALEARFVEPLERLTEGVVEETGSLEGDRPPDPALARARERISLLFTTHGKPAVTELGPVLERTLRALLEDLESVPETVPGTAPLMPVPEGESVPEAPPDPETARLPVRRLFEALCGGGVARRAEARTSEARDEFRRLGGEIRRLWQAIMFHIQVARSQDASAVESPGAHVRGVLERTSAQLIETQENGRELVRALTDGVRRDIAEETRDILDLLETGDSLRVRSDIAGEEAVRRFRFGRDRAAVLLKGGGMTLRRSWTTLWTPVRSGGRWIGRQLGMASAERAQLFESLDQSRLEQAFDPSVPPIYRQILTARVEGPEWAELLVNRERELETVARAWERWQRGDEARLAVIGEKGSGKSTLVATALERLVGDDLPVRVFLPGRAISEVGVLVSELSDLFEGPDTEDPAELEAAILEGRKGVVVVEDAHHLFLRTTGGFSALQAFLELVVATRSRIFWVLTIDEYAWRFLDRVVEIHGHFPYEVNTTRLALDKLEEAIMARHRVSGYALRVQEEEGADDEEKSLTQRLRRRLRFGGGDRLNTEAARQEAARKNHFRGIYNISEGNILLGLFYWLRAVERVEGHTVVVGRPQFLDTTYLKDLSLEALHTVAAIMMHGGLSVEGHARVMNLSEKESLLHLTALADTSLLFFSDGEYKINKVLYRPFARLLREKNIL